MSASCRRRTRFTTRCALLPWTAPLLLCFPLGVRGEQPAAVPEPAGELKGALVLGGGDDLPDRVQDRFLELAGGKKARLVVLRVADGEAPAQKKVAPEAAVLHVARREQADDPAVARRLAEATGVWVDGTDPSLLAAVCRDTAVGKELQKLLGRGGVVGGSAAAAAVLGPHRILDGERPPRAGPGVGLLPGGIIVPHALKRDRVDALLRVMAAHPGHFGLGIDDRTAVVVTGRRLTVVGDSYAVVCLSASANRPASVRVLRSGAVADLVALSRAAVARALPPFPPAKPDVPRVAKGALMIGGGGGLGPDIWKRFVELAGGPAAPIVVIPTAYGDPVPRDPIEARMLRRAGARDVRVIHARRRAEVNSPTFLAPIKRAKGVWFTGGRQWRLVDAYAGTEAEKAFHDVLRRGGVIGGSSAGASIQSEYMPRGDPLGNLNIVAEGYERGLGFLKGVAVDQHFFARKRPRDMTELMALYPQLLGIGIDEGTVIVVRGTVLEVMGKSRVAVYDRRKKTPPGGKDYEELPAGARYDLENRKRLADR